MKAKPAEPFPIIEKVKEVLKEATLFGAVALEDVRICTGCEYSTCPQVKARTGLALEASALSKTDEPVTRESFTNVSNEMLLELALKVLKAKVVVFRLTP